MAEIAEEKYNCTMNQLYVLGERYAVNITNNLAAFTAHSPRFVTGFVTNLRAKITIASDLPGEAQVNENKLVDRVELIPTAKFAITDLNALKAYLIKAYPTTFAIMYASAGSGHRVKVNNKNWVETKALFKAMTDFMTVPAKLTQLLANDNMPPTFPAEVAAHELTYNIDYAKFLEDKSTSEETVAKITANNVVKAILSDIGVAGNVIFPKGDTKHDLFVFEKQLDIIAPPGSASLKVKPILDGAFTLLPDISVIIQAEGEPAIPLDTNAESIAFFESINPRKYKVIISGPGLLTRTFYKEVNTGTQAHVKVFMELIPQPQPPEVIEEEPPV